MKITVKCNELFLMLEVLSCSCFQFCVSLRCCTPSHSHMFIYRLHTHWTVYGQWEHKRYGTVYIRSAFGCKSYLDLKCIHLHVDLGRGSPRRCGLAKSGCLKIICEKAVFKQSQWISEWFKPELRRGPLQGFDAFALKWFQCSCFLCVSSHGPQNKAVSISSVWQSKAGFLLRLLHSSFLCWLLEASDWCFTVTRFTVKHYVMWILTFHQQSFCALLKEMSFHVLQAAMRLSGWRCLPFESYRNMFFVFFFKKERKKKKSMCCNGSNKSTLFDSQQMYYIKSKYREREKCFG